MKVAIELEREIVDLILPYVRGLRLSQDLRLAEEAVRAEREIEEALEKNEPEEAGVAQ
jgi:hypothetical protein